MPILRLARAVEIHNAAVDAENRSWRKHGN